MVDIPLYDIERTPGLKQVLDMIDTLDDIEEEVESITYAGYKLIDTDQETIECDEWEVKDMGVITYIEPRPFHVETKNMSFKLGAIH